MSISTSCTASWSIFFFNDTATTEIYTLSLHDALPICSRSRKSRRELIMVANRCTSACFATSVQSNQLISRSEEHTSELQSRQYLVCRLLLEKKNECGTRRRCDVRPESRRTSQRCAYRS